MERRSIARTCCALAIGTMVRPAFAGLTYDLRFTDGTHQKTINATDTGPFAMELWARVSGSDSNHANDGFTDGYITIESIESSGDFFDGFIGSVSMTAPFTQGRSGGSALITTDGVTDWGSTNANLEDVHYMYAKAGSTIVGGGAVGQAVDANTWEFKIASLSLSVTSYHPIGGDETRLVVTRPGTSFPITTIARYEQDAVNNTVTTQSFANVYGGYVSFISETRWDGGASGTGNDWNTAANWAGDSIPGSAACASFGSAGTATTIGINAVALGGNTLNIGMIRLASDANRNITIQNSSATSGIVNFGGVSGSVLDNKAIGKTLSLTSGGAGALSVSFPAQATLNVTDSTSTIAIDASIASSSTLTKTGAGTLLIGGNQRNWVGGLTVSAGNVIATSTLAGGVLFLENLSIAADATLDLNDNDLVVNSGSFSTIQNLVFQGYRQGVDTSATGIVSTTGQTVAGNPILAVIDNALVGSSDYPFGSGHTVTASAIIGKYTYFGDTNLDGQVTADDYGALDANFGATGVNPGVAWITGDTNFDGSVTADDYGTLDANFGLGTSNPLSPATVPEPGLITPAAIVLLAPRRRRRA